MWAEPGKKVGKKDAEIQGGVQSLFPSSTGAAEKAGRWLKQAGPGLPHQEEPGGARGCVRTGFLDLDTCWGGYQTSGLDAEGCSERLLTRQEMLLNQESLALSGRPHAAFCPSILSSSRTKHLPGGRGQRADAPTNPDLLQADSEDSTAASPAWDLSPERST